MPLTRRDSTRRSRRSPTRSGFARRRRWSAAAAPQLQRILAAALEEGGWFGESHEARSARRPPRRDDDERLTAVRTLLAEEARMGMMVGVAVGWALAEELRSDRTTRTRRTEPDGDQISRPLVLRAHRGRRARARRPVPEAQQPGRAGRPPTSSSPTHILDHPRPRRPHRRRGRPSRSAPAPTASAIVELANWLERAGRRERQRPEPRRHGRVRLGLGEAGPGLAHEHAARLGRDAVQRRDRDRDRHRRRAS